jgi:fructose-bisphosphate aldolase, class I
MELKKLIDTVAELFAADKGLLAMDESNATCNKRFARLGIPETEEARRTYRELIITTPGLGDSISGVILYDETIRQVLRDGIAFPVAVANAGIVPGIKVDLGVKVLAGHPGEAVAAGLDGLRDRLAEYATLGARFAKWRAVFSIGDGKPTWGCIEANALGLARFAAMCQEAGLAPMVEPEILMEGSHSMAECRDATEEVHRAVFAALHSQGIALEGLILKSNMVLPGLNSLTQESVEAVAAATVKCLLQAVPAAVPGIAFLSGGQSAVLASARLSEMNARFKSRVPWQLSFSYARAIQQPALETWLGREDRVSEAQEALRYRAECNRAARQGTYHSAHDTDRNGFEPNLWISNPSPSPVGRRRRLVVGNWKVHTTAADARQLVEAILAGLGQNNDIQVALCPPFPYLALVGGLLRNSGVALGAQNLFPRKEGAFTGEVSPTMLLDLGCKYVILGHSERRLELGESDQFINQKVLAALQAGLEVILCVGETYDQRKNGQTETVVCRQLSSALSEVTANQMGHLVVAYEPVWAIGSLGRHASPAQAQEAHAVIRRRIEEMFGEEVAWSLVIQYGGSVRPGNAHSLLGADGVDGALIGGSSLDAEQFLSVVRAAASEPMTASEADELRRGNEVPAWSQPGQELRRNEDASARLL